MPTISFEPSGKNARVDAGTTLIHACRLAGVELATPCGEKGLCGKCRVRVLSGNAPADARQQACLPPHLLENGWRAACVLAVENDLALADPDPAGDMTVLADFSAREPVRFDPIWEKRPTAPPPSLEDQRDDFARVFLNLFADSPEDGPAVDVNAYDQPRLLPILRALPSVLRDSGFACKVLGVGGYVLDVRAADDDRPATGLAVDVGTTTIAAALCDLATGKVLAVASGTNPQSRWGDDVVSRMEHARNSPENLRAMRDGVVLKIEMLSRETVRSAGLDRPPLTLVAAGNTVMTHLLLGVPPDAIAVSPFTPAFAGRVVASGVELGWKASPPVVATLPAVSGYVGGDITAGILAHNLHKTDDVVLLLDVGTNGEIALSVHGRLHACATAAGPAFEGARIQQGMRALPGAVSRVRVLENGDLAVATIDSAPALGVCGTGLLDAVAALRRTGLVDEYGRIPDDDEFAQTPAYNARLARRLHNDENGRAVWLVFPDHKTTPGSGVRLTQRDVREFQLAKGAVAAGVRVLAAAAGVGMGDIGRILLAGGFGNYLDPVSAGATGLLPAGIDVRRARSVGNASLAGARLCLFSREERKTAEAIARSTRYVELSGRGDFQQAFSEEMVFPGL